MTSLTPETIKPYTRYVCPEGATDLTGHRSFWTGAFRGGPHPKDHLCGATLVEEVSDDGRRYIVEWEMCHGDPRTDWRPSQRVYDNAAAADRHVDGLRQLVSQGEPIRNVRRRTFATVEITEGEGTK